MSENGIRKLFVNVPVRDLVRSIAFFEKLGFVFDDRYTNESAACMVVGPDCAFMLLTKDRFRDFTTKEACDTARQAEAIFALQAGSRAEVDEIVGRALAAGGKPSMAKIDHGFLYGGSFQDLDGHLWEVFSMDPDQAG